jgi:hypothetical protein
MPVRVKKTRQNKKIEPPFRFNRNGKGSRPADRTFRAGGKYVPVDPKLHQGTRTRTHADKKTFEFAALNVTGFRDPATGSHFRGAAVVTQH